MKQMIKDKYVKRLMWSIIAMIVLGFIWLIVMNPFFIMAALLSLVLILIASNW